MVTPEEGPVAAVTAPFTPAEKVDTNFLRVSKLSRTCLPVVDVQGRRRKAGIGLAHRKYKSDGLRCDPAI